MVFLHDPPVLSELRVQTEFNSQLTQTAQEYLQIMRSRLQIIREAVREKKLKDQQKQLERQKRMHIDKHVYAKGDLVYYYCPRLSDLQTSSRKFKANWVGPLQIVHILDTTHYILADLEGRELKLLGGAHINMIKPYLVHFRETKENRLVTHNNLQEIIQRTGKLPAPML
jgi:hypothetical protein